LNFEVSIKIKEITKCDGEATANNRKAKLIFFYEWVINGEWEGKMATNQSIILNFIFQKNFKFKLHSKGTKKNNENKTNYKGTFEVPNLSEEHEPKDVDVILLPQNRNIFLLKV
jgi:activator of HSP90 ATPase